MSDLRIEAVGDDVTLRDWRYVHNLIIPTDPLSADAVRERAGRHRLDVAYAGHALVGCMTVRPPGDGDADGDGDGDAGGDGPRVVTVIARILPEYRGHGLGARLYAHGLAQARALGAQRVRTVVLESNADGLRFALAHGFTETGRYLLPGDTVAFVDLEADAEADPYADPYAERGAGPEGAAQAFVPAGFTPPLSLEGDGFRLEPLREEHNARDHAAWTASIAHIRATPGYGTTCWPPPEGMSEESNLSDLQQHVRDFAGRRGFAYTVLEGADGGDEVIGCVYVYPGKDDPQRAHVSSWVRADRAGLDAPLYAAVTRWLAEAWPFAAGQVDYAPR
ncbi:hypothetical protein KPP03845_104245 [Streptomyces xanthophaeus]|uniref:GNAT family N-acetyltransferase n=1 Tax=Streptomyces xanthophaeus TaxID=67385 RepID=UPI002FEDFEF6|nr:hypothetical protein KPP03845_104245 [Streptomyces xanthophaeus]